MKVKLLLVGIVVALTVLISCKSCTSSSAQYPEQVKMENTLATVNFSQEQDTTKRIVVRREIKKMEIDTTWQIKRDSAYKRLDKIERNIRAQQKIIDSIIIHKK